MKEIDLDPKKLKGLKVSDLDKTTDGTEKEVLVRKAGGVELYPVKNIIDTATSEVDGKISDAFRSLPYADEFDYLDTKNLQNAKNINGWLSNRVRGGEDDNENFVYKPYALRETLGIIIENPRNNDITMESYNQIVFNGGMYSDKVGFVKEIKIDFFTDANTFEIAFFTDFNDPFDSIIWKSETLTAPAGLFEIDLSEFSILMNKGVYVGVINADYSGKHITIKSDRNVDDGNGWFLRSHPYSTINKSINGDGVFSMTLDLYDVVKDYGPIFRPGQFDLVRSVFNIVNELTLSGGIVTHTNRYGSVYGNFENYKVDGTKIVLTKIKDARPNFTGRVNFTNIQVIAPTTETFHLYIYGRTSPNKPLEFLGVRRYLMAEKPGQIFNLKVDYKISDNYELYIGMFSYWNNQPYVNIPIDIDGPETTLYKYDDESGVLTPFQSKPMGIMVDTIKLLESNIVSKNDMNKIDERFRIIGDKLYTVMDEPMRQIYELNQSLYNQGLDKTKKIIYKPDGSIGWEEIPNNN